MKAIRYGILGPAALLALAVTALGAAAPKDNLKQAVFTETNAAAGNAIAIYSRAGDGSLVPAGTVSTGGLGTGAPLGSQGAVVLSKNGSQLFAVNAGDDTISAFAVGPDGLTLQNVVPSGGSDPISLTVHDQVLYVLNAGNPAGISGFTVDKKNGLSPLAGSTQTLSAGAASPEQVSFDPHGRVLVVAEKGSNTIDTFQVGHDGIAGSAQSFPSVGDGPYGFDFDKHGDLIVSEAASGTVSSYSVSKSGDLTPIAGPVSTNGQVAACWLVVTGDGRYAYTTNGGSGTVSGFAVDKGDLSLADPSGVSADLGAGSHPLDEVIAGKHFLYVLADGIHTLAGFRIEPDGSLTPAGSVAGLPVGDTGLAAR